MHRRADFKASHFPYLVPLQSGMLRICSLAGETCAALTAEEFEGQTVKSLKTLVAKQIGVPRFRQRWLSEDHIELQDEAVMVASDVQLVVLDYVQAEDGDVEKLFDACKRNDVDQVDELLRKPLDPSVTGFPTGMPLFLTALHHAAEYGHVECIDLLLDAGADKDALSSAEQTALHRAAGAGHLEVVRLLLEAGVDKNVVDCCGRKACDMPAVMQMVEAVQLWETEASSR